LQEFVSEESASMMVQDYDMELILPLLMKVSQFLLPYYSCMLVKIEYVFNGFLFGFVVLNAKATHVSLVKITLVTKTIVISANQVAKTLEWLKENEV